MAGMIKQMVEEIYRQRANGEQRIVNSLKVRLILKGVYPDTYTESSTDDPEAIEKVKKIAEEMGVRIQDIN